jgi:hypothetical protein
MGTGVLDAHKFDHVFILSDESILIQPYELDIIIRCGNGNLVGGMYDLTLLCT